MFQGIAGCPEGVPGVFQAVPRVLRSVPGCSGFYGHRQGDICIELDEQIVKYSIGFKATITWNNLP